MKIVFISNFLNHHQLPLCLELQRLTDNHFIFGACTPVPEERLNMGYYDMNKQYDFVICAYENDENKKRLLELVEESDILIVGGLNSSVADQYVRRHLGEGKVTYQYLERIYKRGVWRAVSPRGFRAMRKYHARYNKENVYVLCASAYTAWDLGLTRSYVNKTYKWGYFPKVNEYDVDKLIELKRQNIKPSILWCGRLIDWKHPELAVRVAKELKQSGYDFEMTIIGNGVLENEIRNMISDFNLSDCVTMTGAMSPERVRDHMERANIYLFTSDFNEGWGAVLNESMNSACAVVSSCAIGSAPFLIEHGKNGYVYKKTNFPSLYKAVKELIDNQELQETFGRAAYETMIKEWSPENAAKRIIELSESLLSKKQCTEIQSGPCSVAYRISNGSMYRFVNKKNKG